MELPQLTGVQFEISSLCNFRCVFCPVSTQEASSPAPKRTFVDEDIVYKVLDAVKELKNLYYFTFSFIGEPLMHPKVFDYIRAARERDLPVLLVTNGTLLHDHHFDLIRETRLERLKLSLQVADEKNFPQLSGTTMSYDEYVSKIVAVLKAKQEGRISCTIYIDIGFNPLYTVRNRLLGIYGGDQYIERNAHKLANNIKKLLMHLTQEGITHTYENITIRQLGDMMKHYWDKKGYFLEDKEFLTIGNDIIISLKGFWDHYVHEHNMPINSVLCKPNKMVIDIDGDVTVCNRDICKKTVIANIYHNDMTSVFEKVKEGIDMISKGKTPFEFCHYCKGYPTRRVINI